MHEGVRKLCIEAAWRVKALMIVRQFYPAKQMIQLYKCRVLSYIEAGSVAFLHAADSVLAPLCILQRRFLRFLGLDEEQAFLG